MADGVEITDSESARAWLETRDHQTSIWFAARYALRSVAELGRWEHSTERSLTIFTLRSNLIGAAAATSRPADLKLYASPASDVLLTLKLMVEKWPGDGDDYFSSGFTFAIAGGITMEAVARTIVDKEKPFFVAAAGSADSVGYNNQTGVDYFSAVTNDVQKPLNWEALWPRTGRPEELISGWDALKQQWAEDDANWSFWIDWYEKILNGQMRESDWELTRRIALEVTPEEWDKGQGTVAERIADIQRHMLISRAPLAERLEINPDTGLFRTVPLPIENARLLTALVRRVQDDLEDAVAGNNGLNERSKEVLVLNRTFIRYANDPQRVEMDFTSVAVGLRRQIHDTRDLPDSEANLTLLDAVEEGARGLRATYPDVARNRDALARQAWQELSGEDKNAIEEVQQVLVDMSDEDLAEEFKEDLPTLINDNLLPLPSGAPKIPGADPATRIFNRVSKMSMILEDLKKKGAETFDSPGNKTVQLVTQYTDYAWRFTQIVQIGLRILGVI
ncbi:MAG: hypothetical protein AAF636_19615 [Pseudomonadota bacterium]